MSDDEEPTGGMMGAGVGVFLSHLSQTAEHHAGDALIEALHDNADAIVLDIYLAMRSSSNE